MLVETDLPSFKLHLINKFAIIMSKGEYVKKILDAINGKYPKTNVVHFSKSLNEKAYQYSKVCHLFT